MKLLFALVIVALILWAAWRLCLHAVTSAVDDLLGGGMLDDDSPSTKDDVQ